MHFNIWIIALFKGCLEKILLCYAVLPIRKLCDFVELCKMSLSTQNVTTSLWREIEWNYNTFEVLLESKLTTMLVKVKSYVAFSFHSVCTGGLGNYKMSVKRMQINSFY